MTALYLWNLTSNQLVTEIEGIVGDVLDIKVVADPKPPDELPANEHPTLATFPLKTKNESKAKLIAKDQQQCYTLQLLETGKTSIYVSKNYSLLLEINISIESEEMRQEQEDKQQAEQHAKNKAEQQQKLFDTMPISTSPEIPGRVLIRHVGLARGGTVRAKHVGTDLLAGIKAGTVGGEIKGYSKLLSDAREEAIVRMKEDAFSLGANAIVSMNFSTSVLDAGMSEMCAFGTAVLIKEE